ncbi:MAG: preprotein translocase subunit SecG [Clostridiales bacterium]|jgi:preprotein translocase subunit SecG|nr:preprotein translocase subunit SecG [Clostridiales bacterium]
MNTVPSWIVNSFPIIRMVLIIAIVIVAIAMVFCILMQPSKQEGMGALSGDTDTYFSKNKEKTLQGTMKRLTIFFACAIFVMSVAFFVTVVIYNGTNA